MKTKNSAREDASRVVQLFLATPDGPVPRTSADAATELNDAFDGLPLGIYEGLRTVDGTRLVALPEHLQRVERSLARLGWAYVLDRHTLCSCLASTLTSLANAAGGDYRVRFDVLAEAVETPNGATRIAFGLTPLTLPSPAARRDGVGVRLLRELERDDPLIKSAAFVAQRRPFPLGAPDAFERLLVDPFERLLECTASSFFGVRGRTIYTAQGGVLEGVTGSIVARIATASNIEFVEHDLFTRDLATLDEAFLTSSIKGVVPIVRVDGEQIGAGAPGPVTRRLMDGYDATIVSEARPASAAVGS